MTDSPGRALVVQTAFLGDVVLTLPLVQSLRRAHVATEIDVVVIPAARGIVENHPDVRRVIVFDKRGRDRGMAGLLRIARRLRDGSYEMALVPHRSLRSALLVRLGRIRRSIGFDRSQGKFLFTDVVTYQPDLHEVERNLSLLGPLGIEVHPPEPPWIFPTTNDRSIVGELLGGFAGKQPEELVAIAPGTVWKTKQWPAERFGEVGKRLVSRGFAVVFIGGESDRLVCETLAQRCGSDRARSVAGRLTLLQSAELIRRSRLLISNDSAPTHMAVATGTPALAIFGATVPAFGFAPFGQLNSVIELVGLKCRPCSIHGGDDCPIGTFECMIGISVEMVVERALRQLEKRSSSGVGVVNS